MRERITAQQLFCILFVSRVVVFLGLNVRSLGGENFLEGISSYLLAMLLTTALLVPVWLLQRKFPGSSIAESSVQVLGRGGKAAAMLYVLYFVWVNSASLGTFLVFLRDAVNPELSTVLIVTALATVAVYGAWRGVETIARCAACVAVLLALSILLVLVGVLPQWNSQNLLPLFANGTGQLTCGAVRFIAASSVVADLAVLLPVAKGNRVKGYFFWAVGTTLLAVLILLVLAGCLGAYGALQNFPVYELSVMTGVRSLQRLDAVFVGVWMMGLLVRMSCDLYACRVCGASICGRNTKLWSLVVGAAVLLLAIISAELPAVRESFAQTRLLLCGTLVVGVLLPLVVFCAGVVRERRKRK